MGTYGIRSLALFVASVVFTACGDEDEPDAHDFVVDNPGSAGFGEDTGAATSDATAGEDDGDGGREISEADIVHVEGERLYALSAYSGLSVIDASAADRLPVLGRFRAHAQPFEMYVDGTQVFMMLSDYGSYGWDDDLGTYTWHASSRLLALDATDPANVELRGEFELPGSIQDSRRVGDVLYLVTYENADCWGCGAQKRTVVTSLDVSDETDVQLVDQIAFASPQDDPWDWGGARSVSSTDERMYVGGIEYSDWDVGHSMIDVIDIADPGGTMHAGAHLEIAGMIESRWQMDEYDGILRVVSQPGLWNSDMPPTIETFTVASAAEITPLASLPMTLPRPENLQSVRFDGPYAYAITFEQTDPLFTLDLTDPAHPQQVGELEIPGWIYHMEPRGDRLLALGFDQSNSAGSINVSLFDVADLATPQLLSRASFGGDWASFGEDQNRIHKAFEIVDDLGLVLVPFSGWRFEDEADDCAAWQSGIQLVDWTDDALTVRGLAPARARARRALLHHERLLGISDKSVEAFDITDRDAPTRTATVALAANVTALGVGPKVIARLATDWWTNDVALEIVDPAQPEVAEPLGRLSLAEISQPTPECYDPGLYGAEVFVDGSWVYLLRDVYEEKDRSTALEVFDASDPTNPTHVGTLALPFSRGSDSWYGSGVGTEDREAVLVADAIVITRADRIYEGDTYEGSQGTFEVIDIRAPGAPVHAASVPRPDAMAHGGLQVADGELVSWHMRGANPDGSKVRFYLERLDVSDPVHAHALEPVNVPGQPVAFDPAEEHAITVDVQLRSFVATSEVCWSHVQVHHYDDETGTCWAASRTLYLVDIDGDRAVVLDSVDAEGEDGQLQGVAASRERLFAHVRHGADGWYGEGIEDASNSDPAEAPTDEIIVLSPASADELAVTGTLTITRSVAAWLGQMRAAGGRLAVATESGLAIVDASDPAMPSVAVTPLIGYGCWDLELDESHAYCAMGEYGLQSVPL